MNKRLLNGLSYHRKHKQHCDNSRAKKANVITHNNTVTRPYFKYSVQEQLILLHKTHINIAIE